VKVLKSEEQDFEYTTVGQSVLDKRTDHYLFRVPEVTPLHVRGTAPIFCIPRRGFTPGRKFTPLRMLFCQARLEGLFARIKEIYTGSAVSAKLTNLK